MITAIHKMHITCVALRMKPNNWTNFRCASTVWKSGSYRDFFVSIHSSSCSHYHRMRWGTDCSLWVAEWYLQMRWWSSHGLQCNIRLKLAMLHGSNQDETICTDLGQTSPPIKLSKKEVPVKIFARWRGSFNSYSRCDLWVCLSHVHLSHSALASWVGSRGRYIGWALAGSDNNCFARNKLLHVPQTDRCHI